MPGPSPLSPTEVNFLRDHGGAAAVDALDRWSAELERQDRTHAAVRQLADTAADTISIAEAAGILGLDPDRISRRIRAKTLWAFRLRKRWRIPRWQFGDDGLLPGLEVIVPVIADDASPSVLEAFMRTPQHDFGGRTPVEHLAGGGDPAAIAGFVATLSCW